jgi:hypothetical protein
MFGSSVCAPKVGDAVDGTASVMLDIQSSRACTPTLPLCSTVRYCTAEVEMVTQINVMQAADDHDTVSETVRV